MVLILLSKEGHDLCVFLLLILVLSVNKAFNSTVILPRIESLLHQEKNARAIRSERVSISLSDKYGFETSKESVLG